MTTTTDLETPARPTGPTAMPPAALWLGATGALPFVACALATIVASGEHLAFAREALVFYGAVILSFLGGVQWGLAVKDVPATCVSSTRLVMSVGPSLIGWAALLVPPGPGLFFMTVAFALVLAIDLRAARAGEAPQWYPRLRVPLSIVVMTSLVVGMLA